MWEKFVEELLSVWAYLSFNPEKRRKLLEDNEENSQPDRTNKENI